MSTFCQVTNAPIFTKVTTVHWLLQLRNMLEEFHSTDISYLFLHHTHRTMKFQCNVNQLAGVLCTHYLDNSNTGAYNTTIKCSWVDNTNTQYTHICTKQMKSENKSLKPQFCTASSTEDKSSMWNILWLKCVIFSINNAFSVTNI